MQAIDSLTYWKLREEENTKRYISDEKEYNEEIQKIYQTQLEAIQNEINSFFGKYAAKENITLAEAKKRVSEHDVKAFERKAKKYVEEKNFSKKANDELRLYNATMRINRLEMLKANIGLESIALHNELDKFMEKILHGRTMEELQRQAGILGKTVLNNAKKANAIVNGSFKVSKIGDKSTFSDRIWQYQDLMREDLGKLLQTGLIQGKNPRAIAKDLKKYWYGNDPKTGGGATYCMERLLRTELARVQTEAQKESFKRNGFSEYIFIANAGCCDACQVLNGKHFKVDKMFPGENAPPIHPNDKCSIAAYEDDAEYNAWLDYLSSGKTTAEWNKSGRAAWEKFSKELEKIVKSDKMESRNIDNRKMSNKLRGSIFHILTDDEILSIKEDAKSLKIPEEILRFNEGEQTGFVDDKNIICIRGDVLPDLNSTDLRDRLSQKAVLAHEYYGHYKHHPSAFRVGDWRDEFRASYSAALNAPNLSQEERRMLMLDAYDRPKEAGVKVNYNKKARGLIFGYDE